MYIMQTFLDSSWSFKGFLTIQKAGKTSIIEHLAEEWDSILENLQLIVSEDAGDFISSVLLKL